MSDDLSAARAWPIEEARKVAARVQATGKTAALFETGYGPSRLLHLGDVAVRRHRQMSPCDDILDCHRMTTFVSCRDGRARLRNPGP
jgi:hypothetical protein